MISVLIIDDEETSRAALRKQLDGDSEVQVFECDDPAKAVSCILERSPDLVFLEIEMAGMGGFDIVRAVRPDRMPATIFMSSRDCYALRAFEAHAFDYLLKPIDPERLRESLRRAKEMTGKSLRDGSDAARDGTRVVSEPFVVKTRGKRIFLKADEIEWIEASGNYLNVHTPTDSFTVRGTMHSIAQKLDPRVFQRIHRSSIVNVNSVREVRPWFAGERVVVLHGGKQLNLSRSYRGDLNKPLSKAA